ncbi:winged helix-turn-helix transcriptional regulator [Gracilibacillus thailandensis]|uniref:ArsR family transcriptional regulator n=1 Tax=Gracilibacillus thailandensis TaxID=563735 RepID=A0A6N7QWH0_9BACI|nr:helix-turn-helix domain-containing protein [Gracilibacillus thailandensis]MRI65874.1 ArsR family transcriptional regulator [Gracilibacillus thailandensis]
MCAEEENIQIDWEKCPIHNTLEAIRGKWDYKIILSLNQGSKRFGELLESLQGISAKTLTYSLKKLEKKNIIEKNVYLVVPAHVEYTLSNKGMALKNVFHEMRKWGRTWEK